MTSDSVMPNSDSSEDCIDARLRAVAEGMAAPPPWYQTWKDLTEQSSLEERLAVYRAIRGDGSLPEEASFFLVSSVIDDIATRDADEALRECEDRLDAIEEKYRLDDGGLWPPGTAPEGYDALRQQYHKAWDQIFAAKLEELGEWDMASLFQQDEARFNQRSDAGRKYFVGEESDVENVPEIWLRGLVEAVAGCMQASSPMGPLGYRYGDDEGVWEIDLYPTPVELIGGAVDGEVVVPGFLLDIEQLRGLFDRIDAMSWHSLGIFPGDEGPHVSVDGVYRGHEVFIQILACAPDDEEPGMKLDTQRRGP